MKNYVLRLIRITTFFLFASLFFTSIASPASISREVKKGERFYKEGKYDEALANYDQALSKKPDDSIVQYNKGAVLYRRNEFPQAEESFLASLAKALKESENLEEKSIYNVANSKFRIGLVKEALDAKSALNSFHEAVQYYKRAMELEPNDLDAKYNYEFVQRKIKEMEKKEEEEKKEQKEKKDQEKQDQQEKQQKEQQREQRTEDREQKEQEQRVGAASGGEPEKEDQKEEEEESKEQRAKSEEQRAKSEEQRAKSEEQRAKSKEQRAKSKEQQQRDEQRKEEEKKRQEEPEKKEQPQEQPEWEGGVPDQMPGQAGEAGQGEMTPDTVEMLLRSQEEEEGRMRIEGKKEKRAQQPTVLKDW